MMTQEELQQLANFTPCAIRCECGNKKKPANKCCTRCAMLSDHAKKRESRIVGRKELTGKGGNNGHKDWSFYVPDQTPVAGGSLSHLEAMLRAA